MISKIPDFVEEVIVEANLRGGVVDEKAVFTALDQTLNKYGFECQAKTARSFFKDTSPKGEGGHFIFYMNALEIEGDVCGLYGARGWDEILQEYKTRPDKASAFIYLEPINYDPSFQMRHEVDDALIDLVDQSIQTILARRQHAVIAEAVFDTGDGGLNEVGGKVTIKKKI